MNLPEQVKISEMLDFLYPQFDTEVKHGEYNRLLGTDIVDDYCVGIFLTLKTHRKRTEHRRGKDGSSIIDVKTLADGTRPADFNFFVMNTLTLRGLYLHYYGSCGLSDFGRYLHRQFRILQGTLKTSAVNELIKAGASQSAADSVVREQFPYQEALSVDPIVRPEKIEELIGELTRLSRFEYALESVKSDDPTIAPLAGYAISDRRSIRFSAKANQSALKEKLIDLIRKRSFTKGAIAGVDSEKRERFFRLMDNPDVFSEHDYDDIAHVDSLNLGDPASSTFITQMLEQIKAEPRLKALLESEAE